MGDATRRLVLPGAIVVGAALGGCSSWVSMPSRPAVPETVLEQRFVAGELVADIDEFIAIADEVHPDLCASLSRAELLDARDELIRALDRPLTRAEFQPLFARFVARIGDGHTSVQLPWPEWWRHLQEDDAAFPCDVVWDGESLRVRRTSVVTPDGALGPGARLVSIDGQPVEELFQDFMQQRSGETEAFRADGVEGAFPVHLWLAGIDPPYALQFESLIEPGRIVGVEAPGMPWGAVARGRGAEAGEVGNWTYRRLDDGAAYLDIRALVDQDAFDDFLDTTFDDLAASPTPGLIIDLRQNGGGNSLLGDDLLDEISDVPWRQHARKDWKSSERYRQFLRQFIPAWLRWMPIQYVHPTLRTFWTTPDGELAVFEADLIEPSDNPRRFEGPVVFLIGPGTFSSAASLAAAVKDYELAALMGSETGGMPGGFGEVYPFELPHTRLAVQTSSARFVRPNGRAPDGHGVRPDYVVPVDPGVADNVLDAARAWIASRPLSFPRPETAPRPAR